MHWERNRELLQRVVIADGHQEGRKEEAEGSSCYYSADDWEQEKTETEEAETIVAGSVDEDSQ